MQLNTEPVVHLHYRVDKIMSKIDQNKRRGLKHLGSFGVRKGVL